MIAEPAFWRERSPRARLVAAALAPAAALYDAAQRWRRATTRPARAATPVFCVGAATLGGVGKTPFALLLAERLTAQRRRPVFLTRGYGGAAKGPLLVDPAAHDAALVGDEALLLAAAAPVVVARDRVAGAALCAKAGADAVVMDDGHQNPRLAKDCAFLLVDADDPDGNGRVFPSGPLREPIARALARADALVLVGEGGAPPPDYAGRLFRARIEPVDAPAPRRVVAFAGVGAPRRFFALLSRLGFDVAAHRAFPDHHPYTAEELAGLGALARAERAELVTTAKDFARLPAAAREGVLVLPVAMRVDRPDALDALLAETAARFSAAEPAPGAERIR